MDINVSAKCDKFPSHIFYKILKKNQTSQTDGKMDRRENGPPQTQFAGCIITFILIGFLYLLSWKTQGKQSLWDLHA